MTTARRAQLRSIMKRAHWQRRERPEVSFAEHLRASWQHHKELAAFYAQTAAAPAGSLRKVTIKSTVRAGERSGRFYGNAARLSRGLYA